MGLADRFAQATFPIGNDYQMGVIVHERVGGEMQAVNPTVITQELKVLETVYQAEKILMERTPRWVIWCGMPGTTTRAKRAMNSPETLHFH